ncbi:MAG: hypothetical protein P8M11_14665, partial [Planctomycetota bacterium]|nr:hypothetical protein [Planctomycetota bacterium]
MDNQDVSPEQPGANAPQPAATQPAAPEPTGQPGVEHDSVSGLSEAGHTDLQEHREAEGSAEASADTMAAPMEAYHSPEPEEEEEIEPVSAHAPFDLLEDELPSFGALLAARPSVFENPKTFESFDRQVDTLETTGEVGRRRGLGLWMLGRYDEAAEALAPFADDDVACYTRGRSLVSAGRSAEAVAIFQSLSSKYPEESSPLGD